jgi:glycosyltransferase involved in cell wall biosynthesis
VNIGLDLRLYGFKHGGIGRYCKELFPRILAMDKQNTYFLFVNEKEREELQADLKQPANNVQIIPCNIRHYSLGEQLSFYRVLNKYNLDLVHFPNFNVPILYKKPFVVTIHDMVHHKIGGAKKSHLVHFMAYKKVIENAGQKAKKVITVSQASKKDIADYLQLPPEKIQVIYEGNSLKTEVEQTLVDRVKKSYLISRPYFLFVGVLERKKNIVNLTRGFDYFLQKYKANMDLVIVGKTDSHYPEIKHHALDIKHSNHLVFTSAVDDWELRALYKGAYAFISASLHEGFGLPGVEALGFGLPLLVSNISVFNEIYDNAALYFNPLDPEDIGEKLNLLVRDGQFYEQFSQKSFERAQLFDWNKAAQETLGIYKTY